VLGQFLVEYLHVGLLPPSEEWFSGLLPYPQLLVSQIVILLLMARIGLDFTRQRGLTYCPRRGVGKALLIFGTLYLAVMIIRYATRMALYPHERWTGGSIPIFFHWVLAAYILVLGIHHWRGAPRELKTASPSSRRRWLGRLTWLTGSGLAALLLAVWIVYLLLPTLLAQRLGIRRPEYAVRIERSVSLTTADGIRLVADIYHPRRAGNKTPTILVRIPYSKSHTNQFFATVVGQMWAERGYTVVIQGTRGRYESGGLYEPLAHEREDGIETLQWLKQQAWYDGRVGMWGGSYFGYTQWVLADVEEGPTAFIVQEASSDFHQMFHPGGAFSLKSALHWAVMSHGERDVTPAPQALARGFDGFPLIEADDRAAGDIPFFNDWVMHAQRDRFWNRMDGLDRPRRLRAPMLLMAGWYDPFLPTQLNDFQRIRQAADPRIAAETRLIVGPWVHAETVQFPDGTVPRNYRLESLAPSVAWFDRHLKGDRKAAMAPVRLYTMGTHQWRDEQEWPLARTVYTAYYLRSGGRANTASGDGSLAQDPPSSQEAADRFVYDPRDPVPSSGGAMLGFRVPGLIDSSSSAGGNGAVPGIERQNAVEARQDVLVYSTAPLERNLEVTGPIELVLYVSTTAPGTDFTGKLVDVWPDGSAYNVSDGIVRRPFDQGAGEVAELTLDLWPTSTVFLRGHRIRLEVSSSNYPRFDRNPNTGRPIATESRPIAATQTVHHSARYPSRLILPVIPFGPSDPDGN
jgi:uncharacterized protein